MGDVGLGIVGGGELGVLLPCIGGGRTVEFSDAIYRYQAVSVCSLQSAERIGDEDTLLFALDDGSASAIDAVILDITQWTVGEVERAFDIHAAVGCRSIVERKTDDGAITGTGDLHADGLLVADADNLVGDFLQAGPYGTHAADFYGFVGRARQLGQVVLEQCIIRYVASLQT